MKTKVSIALVALLGTTLLICGLPTSSAAPPNHQEKERVHSKHGPEVAKRIRELQKYNKDVRSALAVFERNAARNGHSPKIDEAFSVTRDPAGGTAALKDALRPATTPFRKVGFTPQTDYSAYGLETILIPTYYALGEWQGTIIFNKFDPNGSYLGEYVADVVITSDSTMTFVDVSFEVSFEGDNAYLEYGDPSTYGNLGDPGAGGGFNPPPISSAGSATIFKKAAFTPQLFNPFRLGQRIGNANPRVRQYVRCTALGSGAVAIGCGIGGLVLGPAVLPECALIGVATANAGCGLSAIFRVSL